MPGALEHLNELCAPYASVIDIDPAKLPAAEDVNRWSSPQFVSAVRHDQANKEFNPHVRQLLHVGYKIAAKIGPTFPQGIGGMRASCFQKRDAEPFRASYQTIVSMKFIHHDFLLQTSAARRLYHKFAESEPILDYHCHLPPRDIAENRQFKNLFEIWLEGDHYKWRAMRANGCPNAFAQAMQTLSTNSKHGQPPSPKPCAIRSITGLTWS